MSFSLENIEKNFILNIVTENIMFDASQIIYSIPDIPQQSYFRSAKHYIQYKYLGSQNSTLEKGRGKSKNSPHLKFKY